MDTAILSLGLGIIGPLGLLTLLVISVVVTRPFWNCPTGSYRWHIRNLRLKQVSALATLFCLTMLLSYGILHEDWAFIYLILTLKTGTWWLRFAASQRA